MITQQTMHTDLYQYFRVACGSCGLLLPFLGFLLSIFEQLVAAQLQEGAVLGRMKVEQQLFRSIISIP